MHPGADLEADSAGDEAVDTATDAEFETWQALKKATDTKRANLIADIVGHPSGSPSVEELDYMNPDMSEDSIRRHLSTLEDVDIVERLAYGRDEQLKNYPRHFFTLTNDARELFDRNNLFPEESWKRVYAAVEKTDRIRDLQQIPRPAPGR